MMRHPRLPLTLATSYSAVAAREAGAVANEAERRNKAKYSPLEPSHHFVPLAVESLSLFGPETLSFIRDLGRRIMDATQEPLSYHHLRLRITVAVQRGNTAALLGYVGGVDMGL